MVRKMNESYLSILLPFPVGLLCFSFLIALIAIGYFCQKNLSSWGLIIAIIVSIGIGSFGGYHLSISIKPNIITEKAKYCRVISEHLSFSKKYVFENEKNQEVVVSFPFFSDKETILSDPLVPNQEYNLAYETRTKLIVEVKKNSTMNNNSTRIIITDDYSEDDSHYSSINGILKLSILPFSVAAILLLAAV